MMKMHKHFFTKTGNNSRGFSLLEVLLGITVFMIGMLGVTALNISSLKSNTFSGNMSEAVIIAGDKLEEILNLEYVDPCITDPTCPIDPNYPLNDIDGDGTNQDLLPDPAGPLIGDGIDDVAAGGTNFGLDHTGTGAADHWELGVGKNGMYDVYWNVALDEPMPNCKIINVIVRWQVKDVWRQVNMSTIRVREL
jgi:type IV pilus assembly protein PilV